MLMLKKESKRLYFKHFYKLYFDEELWKTLKIEYDMPIMPVLRREDSQLQIEI